MKYEIKYNFKDGHTYTIPVPINTNINKIRYMAIESYYERNNVTSMVIIGDGKTKGKIGIVKGKKTTFTWTNSRGQKTGLNNDGTLKR